MSASRRFLSAALPPLLLSALSAVACYASAGPTLGVFLGGVLFVTLLIPPLVLANDTWQTRLVALAAVLLPFWIGGLVATIRSQAYVREWAPSCVVLTSYAVALSGLSAGLRLTRLPAFVCAAIVTVSGLAWLTWPIYMSRAWEGTASAARIAPFVTLNPALVINGQLHRALGVWTEQSIAYHLTDLSQNVPYTLPRSILPCVLTHLLFGSALLALSAYFEPRFSSPSPTPTPVESDAPAAQ
jgi:hypothetical protein